ncbi:MAG: hypothetical protein CL748_05060 [Chloroflexi bacterium]|nr:hypothetical protein [Chloroflexota bacterium]
MKKNYLFFIVHPSKYHVFKNTINILKSQGNSCDIVITSKDVLEQLIINEGWEYTNIFPEGRKIKGIPTKIGAIYNTFRTILRLRKYIGKKTYDLFVTDDLLVVNGWFRKIPTLLFQDDDITAVPESQLLFIFAKRIISPSVSNMGRFNVKKIPFLGFKELGGLHPNRFKPDYQIVKRFNPSKQKYFIIRLVSLQATHDTGKKGLTDEDVIKIISLLERTGGKVFITSERELPSKFEPYRIRINPNDIAHALYYAEILISDSQTMSAEAGVLGTPYIRYNDFVDKISYLADLEHNYNLGIGIKTSDKATLFEKIEMLINNDNIKLDWEKKRNKMLNEKLDLTAFLVWLFVDFESRIVEFDRNPDIQKQFIFN